MKRWDWEASASTSTVASDRMQRNLRVQRRWRSLAFPLKARFDLNLRRAFGEALGAPHTSPAIEVRQQLRSVLDKENTHLLAQKAEKYVAMLSLYFLQYNFWLHI